MWRLVSCWFNFCYNSSLFKQVENKKQKLDLGNFQDSWTNEYGFLQQKNRDVCVICCVSVVCRASSVQRHFQTKYQSTFNNNNEKCEAIKRAVSGYKKQVTLFCGITGTKLNATECIILFFKSSLLFSLIFSRTFPCVILSKHLKVCNLFDIDMF